jgi:hypothetical protein
MFHAKPVVYLLYIKLFGDNIYKEWEWGRGDGGLVTVRNLGNW